MPQEHVFAASGEAFRKQSITKKKRVKCLILCCGGSGTPTIDYVIVTETYWDDTVGDTVSNSCKTCAGAVSLDSMAKKNADCDCDGEVGSNDAISLMRFLVHLISTLPEPDLS